jgi:hypothetical protein
MPEATSPTRIPKIGTIYRHKKGTHYLVLDVTNLLAGKENFPTRVVYMDALGQTFSRGLEEWYERYEPAEDLNHQERQVLAEMAVAMHGMKERIHREFLTITGAIAARARQDLRYGKWRIYFDPPPIPSRACDWHFVHDDYDGAPDGNDRRHGDAPSVEDAKRQIDDIEAEMAEEPIDAG